jgi:UDP-2,3-diacylglucosamine hydrolase
VSRTLFISDLHLCAQRPLVTRGLLRRLDQWADDVAALYILGDLFEHWVGDDVCREPGTQEIVAALHTFSQQTPLFVMHGNRDFLLGAEFANASGGQLIPEGTVIHLGGEPVLLLHGDDLCSDDTDHQHWRTQVRSADWQHAFLSKSLPERLAIAGELRRRSEAGKKTKSAQIMDVNPDAVRAAMRGAGVRTLIHGHTHRPARHALELDGRSAERIVLGDWDAQGWVLEWRDGEFDLRACEI